MTAASGTDLGRRICEQRHRVGLSRAEAADRAGLSVEYLAYLESSQGPNPTQATLIRLAAALGTSADALAGAGLTLPPGQRGAAANPVLTSLTADECRALIAPGGVGRVLFVEPGRGPVALPVNYRIDGADVVFRTGAGAGIAAGIRQAPVSFDVDHLDETLGEGWSVLVTGSASVITDPAERDRATALGVEPWAGGERPVYMRLRVRQVTGRAIRQPERDRQRVEVVPDQGGLLVARGVAGQDDQTGTGRSGPVQPAPAQPGLTPDEVATVISVAARAPSLHNTQPWRFRPQHDCIDLLADPDRKLTAVDPAGRELMISCGAAVFGLRLGLRKLGRVPAVALQPDPAEPLLLARIWPAGHAARTPAEADLIAAVPHRHTHRGPFSAGQVPARLLESLATDAGAEGCELVLITDPQIVGRLARLVRRAGAQQRANPEMSAELARWVRPAGSRARDGVPATARLADVAESNEVSFPGGTGRSARPWLAHSHSAARRFGERLAPRDFGQPGTEQPGGEPPAATAVLMTPGDTPADWLRAGQALDRLLLRAAARWVFASLQSQPIESPRHRRVVRALVGEHGQPQLLLQFGRANTAPATPRRPQAELLVTD